jgi:hypothetical protein
MKVNERKKILESALIDSFVDDYKSYKNAVEYINNDLSKANINYQYSYDEFCVEFLNETLHNLEDVDILDSKKYNQFYSNFWSFNLYTLQSMLTHKLNKLGYKYEDLYKG